MEKPPLSLKASRSLSHPSPVGLHNTSYLMDSLFCVFALSPCAGVKAINLAIGQYDQYRQQTLRVFKSKQVNRGGGRGAPCMHHSGTHG
jgi:hypothetical protein